MNFTIEKTVRNTYLIKVAGLLRFSLTEEEILDLHQATAIVCDHSACNCYQAGYEDPKKPE